MVLQQSLRRGEFSFQTRESSDLTSFTYRQRQQESFQLLPTRFLLFQHAFADVDHFCRTRFFSMSPVLSSYHLFSSVVVFLYANASRSCLFSPSSSATEFANCEPEFLLASQLLSLLSRTMEVDLRRRRARLREFASDSCLPFQIAELLFSFNANVHFRGRLLSTRDLARDTGRASSVGSIARNGSTAV